VIRTIPPHHFIDIRWRKEVGAAIVAALAIDGYIVITQQAQVTQLTTYLLTDGCMNGIDSLDNWWRWSGIADRSYSH